MGTVATFSVTASNIPAPWYQWCFNGAALTNQTNAILTLNNVQITNAGSYTVMLTNTVGAVTSMVATLTIWSIPAIASQPQSTTNIVGTVASFSVTVSNAPDPWYQWCFNGTALTNQTNAILTLNNVQTTNAGGYTVVLTNVVGSVTSPVATLTIWSAPVITSQPQSQTNIVGSNATFSVAASGIPAPWYQWCFNGAALTNQTNVTLTLNNVQTTDAGSYTVVLTNTVGAITSAVATLTIWSVPTITSQPQNQTNIVGTVATFSVTASNLPAPSYQWYKSVTNDQWSVISNATSSQLSISNCQSSDAGSYTVVLTNVVGAVTSSVATLTIWSAPTITSQPLSMTNIAGTVASFSASASGSPTPWYQWYKSVTSNQWSAVSNATDYQLSISNCQSSDAGSYTVVATNMVGAATSAVATLTIWSAPAIASQPQSRTNNIGTTAGFGVSASGAPTPRYQWCFNGIALPNQTNTTLALYNVQATNVGSYTVILTNVAGTLTSAVASLTVWIPPAITAQPQNLTNVVGTMASFSVTASGTPTPWYQWRFNGTALASQTNATLALNNVQATTAGSYTVVVTNTLGSVTSTVATLTIWSAPIITAQPQDQTNVVGSTVGFNVTVSSSPAPWYQWYFNGTALTNQTNNTLTLSNVQTNNAGSYTVAITNLLGSITSAVATLTVSEIPMIVTHPTNQTVYAGGSASFTVGASGLGLLYQWYGNGTQLPGATNAALTLTNIQAAQEGNYYAVVSNPYGSVTSSVALLALRILPLSAAAGYFYFQNASGSRVFHPTNAAGSSQTSTLKSNTVPFGNLRISLYYGVGGGPLQTNLNDVRAWNWNGSNSANSGITGNALLAETSKGIIGFGTLFAGQFSAGNASSNAYRTDAITNYIAQVRVWDSAAGEGSPTWESFQQKLMAGTLPIGTLYGLSANFNQAASNPNNTPSPDPPSPLAMSYWQLTTVTACPPVIVVQPLSQTNLVGTTASFSVTASGNPAPWYQWQFNGTALNGQTNASLTLVNVQATNAGNYSVVVTNSAGSQTSAVAVLTIGSVPAISGQPQSLTNIVGTTASLSVTASGVPAPWYQWWLNGTNLLANQTNASLTLTNVQRTNAGGYTVVLTNSVGTVTSAVATLTVWSVPVIVSQPVNQINVVGTIAGFGVSASGTPVPSYQWYFNGALLVGQTNSTLTLNNVQTTNAGNYVVVAGNVAGSVTSSIVTLTVWALPAITSQPVSQTNIVAATASFSVSASGTPAPNYQWQFNGASLLNQTNTSLVLTNVQLTNAGSYTVVVTNAAGSVTSAVAALTIWVVPAISSRPQSVTNLVGTTANFSVTASGTPTPWYQWYFNGTALLKQTNASLTLTNVQLTNAGSYVVGVTNAAGSVTSAVALTIWAVPAISSQPQSVTNLVGTTASFSVSASGTPTPRYQWQFNGTSLLNQTNASLTLANVQLTNAGSYTVVVTNVAGSVTSSVATLTVWSAPAIASQPQSATNIVGTVASFSLTASGIPTPWYQWCFNGTALTNQTNITLTLNNVQATNAGSYTVVLTNVVGSVTSSVATLTVWSAPAIASQPQSATNIVGTVASFSVTASGIPTPWYQWCFNGMELTNQTNTTLTLDNVQTTNAGSYTVVLTNVVGSVTSSVATLTVWSTPAIASQPQSATNIVGTIASFSVIASGVPAPWYQWYKSVTSNQWSVISDATNYQLSIINCQFSDAANYTVVLTNMAGSVTSTVATLTVLGLPQITLLTPTNQTVPLGSNAVFMVTATGSTPLYYYWYLNSNFASVVSTQAGVTNPAVNCTNHGDYYNVLVSNAFGIAMSEPVYLGVTDGRLPSFSPTLVPVNVTLMKGTNWGLPVGMTDNCNLATYRWYLNLTNLLVGQTGQILNLSNIKLNDSGIYTLIVSNLNGVSPIGTAAVVAVQYLVEKPTVAVVGEKFQMSVSAEPGRAYWLESRDSLTMTNWVFIRGVTNVTGPQSLQDQAAKGPHRFYRIGSALVP